MKKGYFFLAIISIFLFLGGPACGMKRPIQKVQRDEKKYDEVCSVDELLAFGVVDRSEDCQWQVFFNRFFDSEFCEYQLFAFSSEDSLENFWDNPVRICLALKFILKKLDSSPWAVSDPTSFAKKKENLATYLLICLFYWLPFEPPLQFRTNAVYDSLRLFYECGRYCFDRRYRMFEKLRPLGRLLGAYALMRASEQGLFDDLVDLEDFTGTDIDTMTSESDDTDIDTDTISSESNGGDLFSESLKILRRNSSDLSDISKYPVKKRTLYRVLSNISSKDLENCRRLEGFFWLENRIRED